MTEPTTPATADTSQDTTGEMIEETKALESVGSVNLDKLVAARTGDPMLFQVECEHCKALTSVNDPACQADMLEARADLLERLRPKAVKQTLPRDWVLNLSVPWDLYKKNEKGFDKYHGPPIAEMPIEALREADLFLQGVGARRVMPLLQIVTGNYRVHKELIAAEESTDKKPGHYAFIVTISAFSKVTGGVFPDVMAGRASDDRFFLKQHQKNQLHWTDVRSAAVTGAEAKAVAQLVGLQGLLGSHLEEYGIDLRKCRLSPFKSPPDTCHPSWANIKGKAPARKRAPATESGRSSEPAQNGAENCPGGASAKQYGLLRNKAETLVEGATADEIKELIGKTSAGCRLTKAGASAILDWLMAGETVTLEEFGTRVMEGIKE